MSKQNRRLGGKLPPAAYLSQPYVKRLDELVNAGALPYVPGTTAGLLVKHDPDCPRLTGGLCRCTPELELVYQTAKAATS